MTKIVLSQATARKSVTALILAHIEGGRIVSLRNGWPRVAATFRTPVFPDADLFQHLTPGKQNASNIRWADQLERHDLRV